MASQYNNEVKPIYNEAHISFGRIIFSPVYNDKIFWERHSALYFDHQGPAA